MHLKTSKGEKVTYSVIGVFVLFVRVKKRKQNTENKKQKKREKSPQCNVNVLGSIRARNS